MPRTADTLASTVKALRRFVPAKDFDLSKKFDHDFGFHIEPLGDALAEMRLGSHAFLLPDDYVEAWAGNLMMHMLVDDLDAWWAHVASIDFASRYGVQSPRAPKLQSWGLGVAYVFDPSGVLWHTAAPPQSIAKDPSGTGA